MIHHAAPAWTLKGKKCGIDELNDGHKDDSPGPKYNMSEMGTKTSLSGFTTGKSHRSQINHGVLNNPSPSHYNANDPNLLSTHSITIPKDAKLIQRYKQQNPDPAAYKPNQNFVKTAYPNFSMGSKYPSIMDNTDSNPGPCDYRNPQLLLSSTRYRNSKFGSQSRFSQPNIHHPGPGDYNISKGFITGKNTLSKSRRSLQIKSSPGPGDYKHSDQFENNLNKNAGKTLSKRLQGCFNTQSNTVDAFNNYFKDQPNKPARSFTVGHQKREVFKGSQLPGPTDYRVDYTHTQKDGVKVGFAKSSWVENNELIYNPGPGHYKDHEIKTTRYSIPKSKSVDYLNSNPGAGRYEAISGMGQKSEKYSNQLSGNLIGKSHRTNFVSKNIAGVGDYNILMLKTGGVTIPKANRFPKPNKNPGPGDYNMTSTLSNFAMYRKKM